VRFGDPETQPLLMRLKTDLVDLFEAAATERLEEMDGKIEWDPRPAVCVVLASQGYPGAYERGRVIDGLAEAAALPDVQIFHAGTKKVGDLIETDGGRVLSVAALGDTLAEAQRRPTRRWRASASPACTTVETSPLGRWAPQRRH